VREEMCLLAMGFGKAEVGDGRFRLELLWWGRRASRPLVGEVECATAEDIFFFQHHRQPFEI
jgi:hypothetical protein